MSQAEQDTAVLTTRLQSQPGEPEGTRMLLVKGCADLCNIYLHDRLPPSYNPETKRQQRAGLGIYWPSWQGQDWLMLLQHDDTNSPCARFCILPSGGVAVRLYDKAGDVRQVLSVCSPDGGLADWADNLIAAHGEDLVAFLTKETAIV